MDSRAPQYHRVVLTSLLLVTVLGCRYGQPSCIDCYYREVYRPFDSSTGSQQQPTEPQPPAASAAYEISLSEAGATPPEMDRCVRLTAWSEPGQEEEAPRPRREPLQFPRDMPFADVPPLKLPARPQDQTDEERHATIQRLYPVLPALERPLPWDPGPNGRPLTLESLQQMALDNSPVIRAAAAVMEAARGATTQAGRYPNPTIGYEADTVNTSHTQGYQGAFLNQTIVTGGKLRLAEAAASMDFESARVALRRARVEVAAAVRSAYFDAIVSRLRFEWAKSLARFTEQLYQAQTELVEGGVAAPYEPLQLRVFALQARAAVVRQEQAYLAAWRQLAAAMGLPQLPPTELAGRPDMAVPQVRYEQAVDSMLAGHTDVAIAQNNIGKAKYLLQLARVTPIPNVDTGVVVQHDSTFDPGTTTYNLQLGCEIPVFNRNQGNIIAAQAELYRSEQALADARNRLVGQLAEAFARYRTSRILVSSFQAEALRDQVRAYRGIYERYHSDPINVSFNDVVVAEQTLASTLLQYADALADQWQAVVDVAKLLQVDDIFLMGEAVEVAPIPDLGTGTEEEVPHAESR